MTPAPLQPDHTAESPRDNLATLACPRCAYDLTPMVPPPGPARDASATCSECGLQFTWNGLFDALRQLLPRFVEHAKGIPATLVSIPWTFGWLIFPHRFWRRVTIERRVNIWRAALWFVMVLAVARLAEFTIILCVYLYDAHTSGTLPQSVAEALELMEIAFNARKANARNAPSFELIAFMLPVFASLMFLILPLTRKRAKVRLALVLRCWFYANAMLALLLIWDAIEVAAVLASFTKLGSPSYLDASMRLVDALEDSAYLRKHNVISILGVMTAWQSWYWYSALRFGLRVPLAPVVTFAIVVPSSLATLAAIILFQVLH